MMKVVISFCMWVCLVWVAFMFSNDFSGGFGRSFVVSGMVSSAEEMMKAKSTSGNLKENKHGSSYEGASNGGYVSVDDYRPYDPSPSSKASVKPGPIEHGTPLMPYIPNPSPSPPLPSHDELP